MSNLQQKIENLKNMGMNDDQVINLLKLDDDVDLQEKIEELENMDMNNSQVLSFLANFEVEETRQEVDPTNTAQFVVVGSPLILENDTTKTYREVIEENNLSNNVAIIDECGNHMNFNDTIDVGVFTVVEPTKNA